MRIEKHEIATQSGVVTLTEAKEQLRITHSNQDAYITSLILAAEDFISELTGVFLRKHELSIYITPRSLFEIPFVPVVQVGLIRYYGKKGEIPVTMIDGTDYYLIQKGTQVQIAFETLPDVYEDGMRIDCQVGFTSVVDPRTKMAVRLLVAHWFHNMLPVKDVQSFKVPFSLSAILAGIRHSMMWEIEGQS